MKIPFWFRRPLVALGGITVVIQFIPVTRTNPPIIKELIWDSPKTRAFAQRACFDCHSNETRWPWYSYLAPMSWMIVRDVNEARDRLNFSEIGVEDRAGPPVKRLEKGDMPPPRYLILHPEARMTNLEKSGFITGLWKSFAASGLSGDNPSKNFHEDHKHKP